MSTVICSAGEVVIVEVRTETMWLSSSKMFKINKIAISRANIILRLAVYQKTNVNWMNQSKANRTAVCKFKKQRARTEHSIKNTPLTASTNSELFRSFGQSLIRWMSKLCYLERPFHFTLKTAAHTRWVCFAVSFFLSFSFFFTVFICCKHGAMYCLNKI